MYESVDHKRPLVVGNALIMTVLFVVVVKVEVLLVLVVVIMEIMVVLKTEVVFAQ